MKIVVSTPYRENSIMSIASAAVVNEQLSCFYTTLYLKKFTRIAKYIPLSTLRKMVEAELNRRTYPDIPNHLISSIESFAELTHVFSRRLFSNFRSFSSRLMYQVKDRFDRAVAKAETGKPSKITISMYAAAHETFSLIKKQGGIAALNFVNSHPSYHNHYLKEFANISNGHHELIPRWVEQKVEKEIEAADLIFVPSRFVAKQLQMVDVPIHKIAVEPYGVNISDFYPSPSSRQKIKAKKHVHCLYVGQISHRKGIKILMEVARQCINLPIRFTLIGPLVSPEVLKNIPRNAVYKGSTVLGGVADAMRKADMFILPTLEDACALVVFEAMASGLPVITTTQNGSAEIIRHREDGLIVPPGDVCALVEEIERLVKDQDWRLEIGKKAREKIERSYSWEDYGYRILGKLEKLNTQ